MAVRTNIEALKATGQSLMPEGFEKKITKQEMADLIAYLQATHQPSKPKPDGPPPLDIGILPGLMEP